MSGRVTTGELPVKIAIIGVTGRSGSRISAKSLRRGHNVTGIVRSPENADVPEGVTVHKGDATQPEQLAPRLRSYDGVINAATFQVLRAAPLLQIVKASGVKRLLVVGGAASLEFAPDTLLLDSPALPDAYKVEAIPCKQFLDDLRAETELDWTFLSPSAIFAQGERTGKFRIEKSQFGSKAKLASMTMAPLRMSHPSSKRGEHCILRIAGCVPA